MKRIKLKEEEFQAFRDTHATQHTIMVLGSVLKQQDEKAWGIIKENYGDIFGRGKNGQGAYIDNKTLELVMPCWKEDEPKAGTV